MNIRKIIFSILLIVSASGTAFLQQTRIRQQTSGGGSGPGSGCTPAGSAGLILLDDGAGGCATDANISYTAATDIFLLGTTGGAASLQFGPNAGTMEIISEGQTANTLELIIQFPEGTAGSGASDGLLQILPQANGVDTDIAFTSFNGGFVFAAVPGGAGTSFGGIDQANSVLIIDSNGTVIWEGATANAFETTLTVVDPTADATFQFPALAAGTYPLNTAGGTNTGASYGPTTGTAAATGFIRFANNTKACWRNAGNSADLCIWYDASDIFNIDGTGAGTIFNFVAVAAPATPAAGIGSVYVDSTSKNLAVKDDAGVVKHGVQTTTCTSGLYATAITDPGAVTCTALIAPADSVITIGTNGGSISQQTVGVPDQSGLWTGTIGNAWLIAENADKAFDFAHAAATDPTLWIHSRNQSTTQWLGFRNTGSHSILASGTGTFILENSSPNHMMYLSDTGDRASLTIPANYNFGFSADANSATGATDTKINRHSAGVLSLSDATASSIRALVGGGAAVASATALPVPTGRVFHITGTTSITSITSTNFEAGVCIALIFDDVLTVSDGNNLQLTAAFVTTTSDTLSLCYDGTNWYETGRSVN